MELVERTEFLRSLQMKFQAVAEGEGHCILLSGEAGFGKTSLIKAFYKDQKKDCNIYQGTCDSLFTPRPLAPVYDIILQMRGDDWEKDLNVQDRSAFFGQVFHELEAKQGTTLLVIEDIHWADEATLDFIKFLGRRISRLHCLFILTYRDNEIHSSHPLRNVLGQIPPDSFTRLQLTPLSKEAVEKMSEEKGYKGEDVYTISGGNPFYVNEILASYNTGIPDNIKDSILSSYNRLDDKTKHVWQILSVLPSGFEIKYLEKIEPHYAAAIHNCLELKILIAQDGLIAFKHELFRRTIETSLSPLLRMELNKGILDLFLGNFEQDHQIERIIHHAKNSNQNELVVEYAPVAANQAAAVGAHIEASKLYLSAIEYYHGKDPDTLIRFYESYAYECYLTNQIKEAIIYSGRTLSLLKEKNDVEKIGDSLRFLSRLWWFDGNGKKAESYAKEAIETLSDQPPSKVKAMAFSNMSQLKMLSHQLDECIFWGEKAIAMAKELGDEETYCHALNNVGTVQMRSFNTREKGREMVLQSLQIALNNHFHDHAGRAYTNLQNNAMRMRDYQFAKKMLEEGIRYCEERDLDSYLIYLMEDEARWLLDTGKWDEAFHIANNIASNQNHQWIVRIDSLTLVATIKMRRENENLLPVLLEAKERAFETGEAQRILPVFIAMLEYEWITNTRFIEIDDLDNAISLIKAAGGNPFYNSQFAFWLFRSRKQKLSLNELFEGYQMDSEAEAKKAAALWKQIGCPYEQALALFEGDDTDKREAISIIRKLGADTVYEKMKQEMRASGIKSIPRGIRKTTRSNPANLTERELDVLQLLKKGLQNKEIANKLYISPKTVDHHISSIFFKLDVNSRAKAIQEAIQMEIIK